MSPSLCDWPKQWLHCFVSTVTQYQRALKVMIVIMPWNYIKPWIICPRNHDDVIKWITFTALLAICAGNSPVPGEFPAQRPVTRSFDVFFDLRLNRRLNKQSWGLGFETLSCPLWRHCNDACYFRYHEVQYIREILRVHGTSKRYNIVQRRLRHG